MNASRRNRGIAAVLAILMLAIFFTLAVSYAAVFNQNELQSANWARGEGARLQAEGGLSFLAGKVAAVRPPPNTFGPPLLVAIGNSLASQLNGTPNLRGGSVSVSESAVTIPAIVTDAASGRTFGASLTMDSNAVVRLKVTGVSGGIARTAQVCFDATPSISAVFKYGVAAKGPIQMKGNAELLGANTNHEADVFTAAYVDVAVSMFGNATLEGDISLADPCSSVSLSSNATVGGETGSDRWDHVHVGVGQVDFPQVDPTVFEPFATNPVNSGNLASLPHALQNIRIAAHTNPTFNNVTIQGVIFIETPNNVKFTGNVVLTGVIATQDAGDNNTSSNTINFAGNSMVSAGVESLPDTPAFHTLRRMPGSFILAPGFEVDFAGNFGMASGCMAAESFKFSGNTGGTIAGTIISYGDTTFTETGTSDLVIDRSHAPAQPPGFTSSSKLVIDMDSYGE
jgi:hypothetical protein